MQAEYVLRNSKKMEETRTFWLNSNGSTPPNTALAFEANAGVPLKILRRESNGLLTVLWGNEIITGVLKCSGERRDQIELVTCGRSYSLVLREVAVDAMEQALISTTQISGKLEVHSPIPGLVKAINVKVGDRIQSGQPLVILEAMKMENEISASSNGILTAIFVEAGQTVSAGVLLLTLTLEK